MPTLLVYYPEKEKRWTLQVPGDQFVIGRSHEADVCIPVPSISKKHVILQKKGPRFFFKDLGSKNGVYINGFRQDHGSVVDEDEIRLGSVLITFYREKPPPKALTGDFKEPIGTLAEISAADLGEEEQEVVDPKQIENAETLILPVAKPSQAAAEPAAEAAAPPGGNEVAEAKEPREPKEAAELPSQAESEPAEEGEPEQEPAKEVLEHPLARPGFIHPGLRASRMPQPVRRGLSAPALLLAMAVCAGIGLLLGHVGSYLDRAKGMSKNSAQPAGKDGSPSQAAGGSGAESAPAETKKVENPLGPQASLKDPLAARRLILRLYLDIAGRPPTRDELKQALSLTLDNIWVKADSKRAVAFDAPEKEIDDAFPRFLGREASASEKAEILELARKDPKYFAFHVATSETYASAKHRRKRTPEQLARSLLTDLCDVVPFETEVKQTLEALKAAKKGIEDPAKIIVQSKRADAGPHAGESGESWIQEAYARFLQRFPTPEEEKSALAELKSGDDGWRSVLLGLAGREEYKEY